MKSRKGERHGAVILMYHSIGEASAYPWHVTLESFAWQMDYLARTHRDVISMDELSARLERGEGLEHAVVITFDDAYDDNFTAALPILERHGFPACVFVPTDLLGRQNKQGVDRLTLDRLRALAHSKLIHIGSHSVTHRMLDSLDSTALDREVRDSKAHLEKWLGESVQYFAYPYGARTAAVEAAVKRAGYHGAVGTQEGKAKAGTNPFALPRYGIRNDTNRMRFKAVFADTHIRSLAYRMLGWRPRMHKLRSLTRRIWVKTYAWDLNVLQRVFYRLMLVGWHGPVFLPDRDIGQISRKKHDRAVGTHANSSERKEIVSIGVFAYNRFDLLKETCASLGEYVSAYGGAFEHEVIFFHDGPNPEIEAWARANPLFNRVIINAENQGLSYNLNRFWFEESCGKFLLAIEDDWRCEFSDDFLARSLAILREDDRVGCVRLGRRNPDDYRTLLSTTKIGGRIFSETTYETAAGHRYRLQEKHTYANSCTLHAYAALAATGRIRDNRLRPRSQEGEYLKRFDRFWASARGAHFADSPFVHIGAGRSCQTWGEK